MQLYLFRSYIHIYNVRVTYTNVLNTFIYFPFFFRQLCMLLSAEDIYRSLAELLLQESNLKFARLMVETLNTILLTTSELFELRSRLRNLGSQVSYDYL